MLARLTLITVIFSWGQLFSICFAQQDLKQDHTIKITQSVNPYEYGKSISYQYYLTKRLGFQTNVGIVHALNDGSHIQENDYGLRGTGFRINPELRFYPSRKRAGKYSSFFIGGGPIFKTMNMDERSWAYQHDAYSMHSYSKLSITRYKNISYGLMTTLGVEGYIGASKRLVYDVAYRFGLTNNHVRQSGDPERYSDWLLQDISVSNRNSGILPYIDLRVGLGYRLGKKR